MRGSILTRTVLIVALLAMLPGCPPRLRIVFDQGEIGNSGLISDFGGTEIAIFQKIADDFMLAEGVATFSRVEWWGCPPSTRTGADNFVIRVYEDNGTGLPQESHLYGFPAGSGHAENTGLTTDAASGNKRIYHYWAEFSALELNSRRLYHISIVNDVGGWEWIVRDDGAEAESFFRLGDEGVWASAPVDMAFQLWQ